MQWYVTRYKRKGDCMQWYVVVCSGMQWYVVVCYSLMTKYRNIRECGSKQVTWHLFRKIEYTGHIKTATQKCFVQFRKIHRKTPWNIISETFFTGPQTKTLFKKEASTQKDFFVIFVQSSFFAEHLRAPAFGFLSILQGARGMVNLYWRGAVGQLEH